MMIKHIGITELALRDAHQSLLATGMAIRFLNEDPWERLLLLAVPHGAHATTPG